MILQSAFVIVPVKIFHTYYASAQSNKLVQNQFSDQKSGL